ncbi:hypothetical protein ACSS6W_010801 [Trichoderma asperelloides]
MPSSLVGFPLSSPFSSLLFSLLGPISFTYRHLTSHFQPFSPAPIAPTKHVFTVALGLQLRDVLQG